ncbi:MAG: hypothetical protein AAF362_19145 [Pseudomonadota bacterium]
MIYHVVGTFRRETAADYLAKLTDGTIASQKPDGAEIVASMERAVVNKDGQVEWSETCYCSVPLDHERATVLDLHFDDLKIVPSDTVRQYDGQAFMAYLRSLA